METEKKWLILVLIIGALFRFLVARDITYLSDEMVHGPHAIGFLHSGLISSIVEAPIWFYLSDMAMKLLGVSLFSMRFLSFFFGSMSILVIYLLTAKMFDKKTALISFISNRIG